ETLQRLLSRLPIVQDVTSDLQIKNPRVVVQIDRDKAAALQLNAEQIEASLYGGFGPSWVSTIYSSTNQYKVLLELQPQFQAHADLLSTIYLKSGTGDLVPLSSVPSLKQDAGPQSINPSGQLPSVTVQFNLKPGVALGHAADDNTTLAAPTMRRT